MEDNYSKLIGEYLQECRLRKRLTLRQMEERTGITFSGIAKYEKGRPVDLNRLRILCENGLKMNMIDFLTEVQRRYHEK